MLPKIWDLGIFNISNGESSKKFETRGWVSSMPNEVSDGNFTLEGYQLYEHQSRSRKPIGD
jgi:hypothetical protein